VEYNGEDYIKLLDRDTMKKLDLSWCKTRKDLRYLSKLYEELMDRGRRWFWVDTGVELVMVPTKYGFLWLVKDEPENSRRIQWLMSRADRMEQKIRKRINDYAGVLAEQPEPKEVLDGPDEGESDTHSDG
jgi:hypothetical protein